MLEYFFKVEEEKYISKTKNKKDERVELKKEN